MTDPPFNQTKIVCNQCRYNLSGQLVGGYCPECGTPVADSFYQVRPVSHWAVSSLVLGVISLVACIPFFGLAVGPIAIAFSLRALTQHNGDFDRDASVNAARAGMTFGIIGMVLSVIAVMLLF